MGARTSPSGAGAAQAHRQLHVLRPHRHTPRVDAGRARASHQRRSVRLLDRQDRAALEARALLSSCTLDTARTASAGPCSPGTGGSRRRAAASVVRDMAVA
nr:unnamed protein product [Leishmania braziliensis]